MTRTQLTCHGAPLEKAAKISFMGGVSEKSTLGTAGGEAGGIRSASCAAMRSSPSAAGCPRAASAVTERVPQGSPGRMVCPMRQLNHYFLMFVCRIEFRVNNCLVVAAAPLQGMPLFSQQLVAGP